MLRGVSVEKVKTCRFFPIQISLGKQINCNFRAILLFAEFLFRDFQFSQFLLQFLWWFRFEASDAPLPGQVVGATTCRSTPHDPTPHLTKMCVCLCDGVWCVGLTLFIYLAVAKVFFKPWTWYRLPYKYYYYYPLCSRRAAWNCVFVHAEWWSASAGRLYAWHSRKTYGGGAKKAAPQTVAISK